MPSGGIPIPDSKLLIDETRLRLMQHLAARGGRTTFMVAYRDLGLDYRGSVAFHLRMLKRGQDGFEGRPRTIVRMTPAGVAELERYSNITAPRSSAEQLEVT
jgi:hypothetical protein